MWPQLVQLLTVASVIMVTQVIVNTVMMGLRDLVHTVIILSHATLKIVPLVVQLTLTYDMFVIMDIAGTHQTALNQSMSVTPVCAMSAIPTIIEHVPPALMTTPHTMGTVSQLGG